MRKILQFGVLAFFYRNCVFCEIPSYCKSSWHLFRKVGWGGLYGNIVGGYDRYHFRLQRLANWTWKQRLYGILVCVNVWIVLIMTQTVCSFLSFTLDSLKLMHCESGSFRVRIYLSWASTSLKILRKR